MRHSLQSTVDILRRRVANLGTAIQNVAFIDSELTRIEHQAELIVEESGMAKDATALSARIDAVTSTFDETQEWMRLHREVLAEPDPQDDRRMPPPKVLA
jgi:hypothetical protein